PAAAEPQESPEIFELKERIKRLERRIKKLEGKPLGIPGSGITDPTAPQPGTPASRVPGVARGGRATGSSADSAFSTATGLSRTFNPAISVNGLFRGAYNSRNNDDPNAELKTGVDIQEIELQFSANVDKWLNANIRFTFEDDEFEIEEAFADVLLMNRLALRAGQFFTHFGKHNLLHQHQFPFIDAPLVNRELFGEEGLLEVGAGLNYLVPVPWYSELIFEFLDGGNDLFNAPLNDDFAYLAHTKNLWDLDENTTVELGGSYVTGRNSFSGGAVNTKSQAAGANLTLKWKPAQRLRYKTLVWQTEYLGAWQETGPATPDETKGGLYSYVQYQFKERWWIQGRYDYFGLHRSVGINEKHRYSTLVGYVPSEFSALRLQYSFLDDIQDEHQVMLQLNFSLGSHPAHLY
ncbi:MAG: hypothetical protein GWN55_10840, partial [Phycisphaerae bacterium]|nr:hypothetical protein [candidate division KSB1 bacterium]NIV01798.1 hypothetical protein [Phycisphaerae bacterium]NIT69432.1 hypothetical protein [candidate division KSB1 bacterium]NIU27087.1 hypothetical protein [candidate division KSB1 bacterium]NIV70285.1 hypothetical protein [Phycisphaerae bacterium]